MIKHQIQSTKFQTNSNDRNSKLRIWNLFSAWNFEFGISGEIYE
jgi:hypothetical protein